MLVFFRLLLHPYCVGDPYITASKIEQAQHRLRLIAGITLSADESSALRATVDVRNKIVHHHADEAVYFS